MRPQSSQSSQSSQSCAPNNALEVLLPTQPRAPQPPRVLVTGPVARHRPLAGRVRPACVPRVLAAGQHVAAQRGLEGRGGVLALELAVVPGNDAEDIEGQIVERWSVLGGGDRRRRGRWRRKGRWRRWRRRGRRWRRRGHFRLRVFVSKNTTLSYTLFYFLSQTSRLSESLLQTFRARLQC